MIKNALKSVKIHRRDETGAVSVEFILMLPLLLWTMAATVTVFDAFRTQYSAQKATTTIADMLSRETHSLTDDYIDGLQTVFNTLTYKNGNAGIRVSVVEYDDDDKGVDLVWSKARGDSPAAHSGTTIGQVASHLPTMADGDHFIVVETFSHYTFRFQPLTKALSDFDIASYATISPRFAPRVCYQGSEGGELLC